MYQYSGLDKVASISEGEKVISSYQYSISGQLASATTDGATENFLWDGLALIRRGDTDYTNEPYVTGGNPVVAGDKVLFNDVLGNTVGIKSEDKLKLIQMTAFGETTDKDAFFTGKPAVNNLGYSFLFRNYRADQGKWQTSDPLGFPDGWNNLAYCGNNSIQRIDKLGGSWIDSIVNSIAQSAIQSIINQAIQAATAGVTADTNCELSVSGLDLSGLSISYTYEDAVTLFLVPLGNGSGTISGSSISLPSETNLSYHNVFVRLEATKYTVFDTELPGSNTSISEGVGLTYDVNQRFGEWSDFSAITIKKVNISGVIRADSVAIGRAKYKEE